MRVTVDVDETLLLEALALTKLPTKGAVVEAALQEMIKNQHRRNAIEDLRGLGWEGDLDAMREMRDFDQK